MRQLGQERLANLVAYHSGARHEAQFRGLDLSDFRKEDSALATALDYCDMTTSGAGKQVTFDERLEDIFSRYDENHIVSKAIHQAIPDLAQSVEETQECLSQIP